MLKVQNIYLLASLVSKVTHEGIQVSPWLCIHTTCSLMYRMQVICLCANQLNISQEKIQVGFQHSFMIIIPGNFVATCFVLDVQVVARQWYCTFKLRYCNSIPILAFLFNFQMHYDMTVVWIWPINMFSYIWTVWFEAFGIFFTIECFLTMFCYLKQIFAASVIPTWHYLGVLCTFFLLILRIYFIANVNWVSTPSILVHYKPYIYWKVEKKALLSPWSSWIHS